MCGIAGAVVLDGEFRVSEEYLTTMSDTMVHRGPDGAGVWIEPGGRVGLAHRRLAILDLSPEAGQPMATPNGSMQLVFNGEIYNHAEIRAELGAQGVGPWRTDHSDTEMILHAFRHWGIDCIERFRGMFAFALWDGHRRDLWLVRDRMGIKPLYWSTHHGRLGFASEIKALLTDSEQPRTVDEEALYHYLSFLTTPAPNTLFAGIRKLPAGTWMRIGADGTIREHRWWDVWDHTEPLVGVPDDEIAERVLAELRTAVSYRKLADVPVGVFLSGGVDSSTNVALFAADEPRPPRTFSIGYRGDYDTYRNELHHARRMAEQVGADHHELLLDLDDLLDFLPRMVALQDEPIADPVCVPLYFVAKLARDNGVIVCQAGEGADELFCGYPFWRTSLRMQRWSDRCGPRSLKHVGLAGLRALGHGGGFRYEWLQRASRGQPVFWSGAEAFTDRAKQAVLSPRLRRELRGLSSWDALQPIRNRFLERAWEPSALHWMTYSDLSLRLPELLLMRIDKMTMGVSLEGRVPFLDHKLVELAMSIPSEVKLRGGGTKPVLKEAVRGLVPDDLIDRPKQGFGVPVHEFFLDRLGPIARAQLVEFCDQTDLLDRAGVERVLDSGRASEAWYLLNLALWWKANIA